MTDNEIVKAFDNLLNRKWIIAESDGKFITMGDVADLINRQKAEIEAWKHYYNECLADLKNAHAEIERLKKSNRNWRRKVQRLRAVNERNGG